MSGGVSNLAVAAPRADAARVAAVRNSLDMKDRAAIDAFGERARREVTAGVDRLVSEVRSRDVVEAGEILREIGGVISGLDTGSLTPKSGIGGLMDSREGRLDRFRSRFDGQWKIVEGLTKDLRDRAERIDRRVQDLNTLHDQAKTFILELDAYLDAGRIRVQETAAAPADHLQRLEQRLADLATLRRAAIEELPLVRLVQNSDAPVGEALKAPISVLQQWRADWVDRLGMKLERGVRIRPDEAGLQASRGKALAALDAAHSVVGEARTRRAEAEDQMDRIAKTVRK